MSFDTPLDPSLEQLARRIASAMIEELFAQLRKGEFPIPREYLSPRQFFQLAGVSVKSQEAMRSLRKGPPYYKVGGRVRYKLQDIRDWIEAGGPVD